MSGGEPRRVSRQDIQLVQNLIERCLQLYMNQKEVVQMLLVEAKIEPGFTELVWQKLEEENREFFKAYHVRLMLKQQIVIFNKLLEQQFELMKKIPASGASIAYLNGSSFPPLQQAPPPCYAMEPTLDSSRGLHPAVLNNGSASMQQPGMHGTNDISAQVGMVDFSTNTLASHSSQIGMINEMNRMAIKSNPCYSSNPVFTLGAEGNVLDTPSTMGDTSFSHGESNSHSVNDSSLLEADTSSFGFLGQIPRNFSLSDLTADFSQSSDILESYARSPFLATDDGNFLDSPGRGCQDVNKRLDTISEAVSYDEFTND